MVRLDQRSLEGISLFLASKKNLEGLILSHYDHIIVLYCYILLYIVISCYILLYTVIYCYIVISMCYLNPETRSFQLFPNLFWTTGTGSKHRIPSEVSAPLEPGNEDATNIKRIKPKKKKKHHTEIEWHRYYVLSCVFFILSLEL